MAEQTFKSWVNKQSHKPTDKITNWEKLTSPYIINKYATWADVYAAAGIEAPNSSTKQKTTNVTPEVEPEIKSPEQIKKDITSAKDDIKYAQYTLTQIETRKGIDSPEYKAKADEIARIQKTIKETNALYKVATKESDKQSVGNQLAIAEEDLKRAKASGDAQTIQDATNAFALARNAAIKAGVKQTSGALLGAEEAGGTVGTKPEVPATPAVAGKPGTAAGVKTPATGGTPKVPAVPAKTAAQKQEEALGVAAGTDFALPETIFKNVPSLNAILKKYVSGEIASADGLRKAIRDDVWYKQNSAEIKNRYVQLFNYRDLVATGQATGNTDYEKKIADLERKLADKARTIGSSAASDPAALRKAAENMYITNVGIDDAMTTDFLAAAIKPIGSMIAGKPTLGYSGDALANYKTLVQTARDNGFQISDILPGGANEQQVLAGIASGKIDINRVQQDARKLAAQGQPQYVRDLLSQGYDLAQVFAPYRKVMGSVLELNPDQIDLNDPLLRTAITDKGDMNLYDFKKAMRADNRWQYTEQAKSDVSTAALNVLKDFGFQG